MNSKNKAQKEVLDSLASPVHGLLVLPPRFGKTKLMIDLIKRDKLKKVLWVTPSTKLRDEDIPSEFVKWRAKSYLKNATIVCYSSLNKVEGEFDVVVLDEYQDVTENNTIGLFNGAIKYESIVGLSGTYPEHEEKREIYKALNLEKLVDISIDDAVDLDALADYRINVLRVPVNNTDKVIKGGSKAKPFMTTEKKNLDYLDRTITRIMYSGGDVKFMILKRMRAIYDSPSKENALRWLNENLPGRKLFFTGSIAQAERLGKYTYHSKTDGKDLQKFMKNQIDEIHMVNAGGVGFTYRNVDHYIIGQANSNKKGDTTQKMARSLLKQEGYSAQVWFVVLEGTKDEVWVNKALAEFDESKIKYFNIKNLKNGTETL